MALTPKTSGTINGLNTAEPTTRTSGSIYDLLHIIEEHLHGVSYIYPDLATGVTLTATTGVGAWTLGAAAEVIPANTVTSPYDLHYVVVESASADSLYQIKFYYGDANTYCGTIEAYRDASGGLALLTSAPIMTPIIPANAKLTAKVATPGDNGETIVIKVKYHTY